MKSSNFYKPLDSDLRALLPTPPPPQIKLLAVTTGTQKSQILNFDQTLDWRKYLWNDFRWNADSSRSSSLKQRPIARLPMSFAVQSRPSMKSQPSKIVKLKPTNMSCISSWSIVGLRLNFSGATTMVTICLEFADSRSALNRLILGVSPPHRSAANCIA